MEIFGSVFLPQIEKGNAAREHFTLMILYMSETQICCLLLNTMIHDLSVLNTSVRDEI